MNRCLVVVLAFGLALLLVFFILPWFNQVADKQMVVLWASPLFWLTGISFTLLTSFVAGSYPALYLSSFQPVKVLKGTFRAGRFASVPRKVLVVVQFTVSLALIIGDHYRLQLDSVFQESPHRLRPQWVDDDSNEIT